MEQKYLDTLKEIINTGTKRNVRGSETRSIFGRSFEYSLKDYTCPVFSHRKIFVRAIIEELLFFISGSSDTTILESKGINIWKQHTRREYLDSIGLNDLPEGSYGDAYGIQLRNFNGVDQLEYVIQLLKTDPTSRRIVISYWNPSALSRMALPPCHILYQFFVDTNTNELSVSFYQRSSDFAMACNYNLVSASLLVFMLCKVTGLKPGKCIHTIGDLHVYENQIESIKKFINNKPMEFPKMQVANQKNILNFTVNDFKLIGYKNHGTYSIPFTT